ncbi:thioredoxin family protein [Neisseria lisongii]|uniref:Thioredoxin family protein n=1 Tax=Neisseria lisongii TaxID=2912188 RepID=A0AAW5AR76_9NEIS|nr:thioredoxin family protein [Neisseria lisongii]MCF7529913.1 thioredoxin family protein [Neisseria lisongii]
MLQQSLSDIEQAIASKRLSLLYVQAPNCGVCSVFRRQVSELLEQMPAVNGVFTDISLVPSIASRFHVLTAPAVLVFFDNKEVYRTARYIKTAELKAMLDDYLQLMQDEKDLSN